VDVRDGVHVLDDGVVLFLAGNCVVLHAMEARTQVPLVVLHLSNRPRHIRTALSVVGTKIQPLQTCD
jgi:hypothetical protein